MNSKIALITGGSRGLGKNTALKLAQNGVDVIITYNSQKEQADIVVSEIESLGRKGAALKLDVSDLKSFDIFFKDFSQTLQSMWNTEKFDFLINNAGFGATIPFEKVTEEEFDKFMNVHFKGVFFLTQKAVNLINNNGRVINLSSGTTRFCLPGYSVYASMKGAVEVFTKYLAKDLGARGITVNVIAPGAIETDFNNAALKNDPNRKSMIASQTPLGRTGVAGDIGGIIAFLCSEDAGWINGQKIEATGGINL